MVEVGGKSPYGQSFDNSVFIIPAILLVAIIGFVGSRLYQSIQEKELKGKRTSKKESKVKAK